MEQVDIQAQDTSGVWRTYHTTQNQSQKVLIEMQTLKRNYPNFRPTVSAEPSHYVAVRRSLSVELF